jgi:hypothetical protein
MTLGYDQPRNVMPFYHRGFFRKKLFGWERTLTGPSRQNFNKSSNRD